ncbi:hypothetical protein GCM10023211_08990 [Orbus sasakiae]|uniref:Immunity protein 17 n=1 Tax=Orbus sasakiae TaxID=1078475 RepID=A0ABP9N2E2_9GAMM
MTNKIDFDCEVEIQTTCLHKEYIGDKGIVVGISEEDGITYGYGIVLKGKDIVTYFDKQDVKPTGRKFNRDDYY